jgi:hypothetical protein
LVKPPVSRLGFYNGDEDADGFDLFLFATMNHLSAAD